MISDKLKEEVLETISPNEKENNLFSKSVDLFLDELEINAKKLNIEVDFFLGGSFGKKTYLKNDFDVDIFCQCPTSYSEKQLSESVKLIAQELNISYSIEKGSRDYISGKIKNKYGSFSFELVPTRKIKKLEDATNSTDYSYLHVQYLNNEKEKNQKLADEIRLTKALLKSNGWYGAESYIGGFSGHVVDLLITYYKNLESFLQEAQTWTSQTIIDPAQHFKSEKEILTSIDSSKISSLIVVDPILSQRNAARALTKEMYGSFIVWVSQISELNKKDFKKNYLTLNEFLKKQKELQKKRDTYLISYEVEFKNIENKDVAGAKIKKCFENYEKKLRNYDFEIFSSKLHFSKDFSGAILCYHIKNQKLPKRVMLRGPPFHLKDAVKNVTKNAISYEIRGSYLWYEVDRKITHIDEILIKNINDFKKLHSSDLSFIAKLNLN